MKRTKRWMGLLLCGALCLSQGTGTVLGAGIQESEGGFFAEEAAGFQAEPEEGAGFLGESGEGELPDPGPPEPEEPDSNSVPYLDANGEQQEAANATAVSPADSKWESGWYVVNGAVTIEERIQVTGTVHLILADGCTLTAKQGINVTQDNNTLHIYAQSTARSKEEAEKKCGKLIAQGQANQVAIGGEYSSFCGTVVINGGVITATAAADSNGAGIGNPANLQGNSSVGSVNINGGFVKAQGGKGGSGGAGIGGGGDSPWVQGVIKGGYVEAYGGNGRPGIGSSDYPFNGGKIAIEGNAVAFIDSKSSEILGLQTRGGMVFNEKEGEVNQDMTLPCDVTIPKGYTLTVKPNMRLEIPDDVTLTNEGTIIVFGELSGNVEGNGSVRRKLAIPTGLSLTSPNPGLAVAAWNPVEYADSYKVMIYKEYTMKEPVIVTEPSYTFLITEAGSYSFLVEAQTENEDFIASDTGEITFDMCIFHAVTFDSQGEEQVPQQFVAKDNHASEPADPVRPGQTFVGWYQDEDLMQPWNFATDLVTRDVTLYAKWEEAKYYTVTFETNGGSQLPSKEVQERWKIQEPEAPVRGGYTFAGWYTDEALTNPWNFDTDSVTGDMILYAKWEEKVAPPPVIYYYTVTFETNGGSQLPPLENIREWSKIQEPEAPVREGYDFVGWYKDTACTNPWDFNAHYVTSNMTLYAKWTESTPEITAPEPVEVNVTGKTTDAVTIQWTEAEGAEGYTIWTRAEGETFYKRRYIHHGNEDLTYTWENKRPGKKYFFIVRAWVQDEAGAYLFSEASQTVRGTTKPLAAQIQSVTVTEEGKLKVRLAGPAKGADRYSLCWSEEENFTADHFTVGIRTSYTTRTLNKNPGAGTWYVRVKAYRDLGNSQRVYGEWSEAVQVVVK